MKSLSNVFKLTLFIILLFVIFFLTSCSNITGPMDNEQEIFYSPQAVEIETNTNTLNNIVSIDSSGNITFSQTRGELELLPGEIIASAPTDAAPCGFLKKVESVNIVGNNIIVSTSNATLEEVFESASIDTQKTLTVDDLESFDLQNGILFKGSGAAWGTFRLEINEVLYDADANLNTDNDQILAKGSIEIRPSFKFKLKIKKYKLKELRFINTTIETVELNLSSERGLSYNPEKKLGQFKFKNITIWVGWVPVVIKPILSIYLGADFHVCAKFETGITQTATLVAGLHYKHGNWNPIHSFNNNFDYNPPIVAGEASVKGYVRPKLSLLLYGIAGPYADVRGYLELTAAPFQTPWWALYGGIEVGVGVEVKFLKRDIMDYYLPGIIDYRVLITRAGEGFNLAKN